MTSRLLFSLIFAAALGSGLAAGLFFAFSSFVMNALGRLPSQQGIAAMQSINITVLNPLFSLVFFGTASLCAGFIITSFFRWDQPGMGYLLAGSLIYLIGSFLVTIVFNVPLNDALALVEPGSAEGANLWTRYLTVWTTWNHIRTAASLVALALFIYALR
ncbi:anthrone oxygenase family protein [Paenibacillus nasutitermitis]|uniref:Membrane protein n=1 Tax=Paenibacillus nasutitermitis TaxID=1652958 RepID=A0A917E169_9BACL|nr:anthrone oxygenase family protein [Paenibacillus nasutitermitis]GGD93962.1 membrane protein [Paenibacillus nasutitermitis]